MENLLKEIAQSLVEQPDEVKVSVDDVNEDGITVYHLYVADSDMGRVIGKQGRIAKAIRTIMRSVAVKQNIRISLEIGQ